MVNQSMTVRKNYSIHLWVGCLLPALAVGQCDALRCHLELNHGGRGARVTTQGSIRCLGDGLGAGQRLGFHRVQVEDVTG